MMKLQFRDEGKAYELAEAIKRLAPDDLVKLVHVCGTHEITITEHGLRSLLPPQIEVLEGPGCPVCVTPTHDLDEAVALAEAGEIIATFGDMLRVPGSRKTLEEVKSEGADVRVVYSVREAVELAKKIKNKEVVFFGIGFETTTPMNAAVLLESPKGPPENFSILTSNKLIPPAMEALLKLPDIGICGFLAPGHVSTIIGMRPYEIFPQKYNMPVVIAGFEPLDILYAIALCLKQLKEGFFKVDNGYPRSVTYEGNLKAQQLIAEVYEVTDAYWRGIGIVPNSGLKLRKEFSPWDAREKFNIKVESSEKLNPGCKCHLVITARATPDKCPLFAKRCTPRDPYGPCMVGEEAMCHIWYRYGGRPSLI